MEIDYDLVYSNDYNLVDALPDWKPVEFLHNLQDVVKMLF